MFSRIMMMIGIITQLCTHSYTQDDQRVHSRKTLLEIGALSIIIGTPIITGAVLGATVLKPVAAHPGTGAIDGAIVGCLSSFGFLCIASVIKHCIVGPIKDRFYREQLYASQSGDAVDTKIDA